MAEGVEGVLLNEYLEFIECKLQFLFSVCVSVYAYVCLRPSGGSRGMACAQV